MTRRPRVGLDLRWLQQAYRNSPTGALGGVAVASRNLWIGLAATDAVDLVALLDSGTVPAPLGELLTRRAGVRVARLPGDADSESRASRRLLQRWCENELPSRLRHLDIDVLHRLDHVPPPRRASFVSVSTVYDLIPFSHACTGPARPRLLRAAERSMIAAQARAAAVVAISHSTARQLVECVPALRGRVSVIPCGVIPPPRTDDSPIAGPYFLHVGTLAGRKNPGGLLEAIAHFRQHNGTPARLVCAGPYRSAAGAAATLQQLARRLGVVDAVQIVEDPDDHTLAALYRRALALVFPSFEEGFGLPLTEALATGTPCIASDIEACHEAAGPLGIFVDPHSPAAIAAAMRSAMEPSHRARVATEGAAWAQQFSIARVAQQYVDVYAQVAGSRRQDA